MPTYTFRTVTVPGASSTVIDGINDTGFLSGTESPPSGDGEEAAWDESPSSAPDIYGANGVPFGAISDGGAVNNLGEIVGSSGHYPATQRGYLDNAGAFTEIDGPGNAYLTWAYGLNDNGQVVGRATITPGDTTYGYVWQNGTMSLFSVPGVSYTAAYGINDSGEVVGYYIDSRPGPERLVEQGFVDVNGTFTTVDVPGAAATQIMAVDNAGDIAGSYLGSDNHWHGFIDQGGTMTFINAPGAADTWVTAENNEGQLAGYFDTASGGAFEGFVATDPPKITPKPTPSHGGRMVVAIDPRAHVVVGHH